VPDGVHPARTPYYVGDRGRPTTDYWLLTTGAERHGIEIKLPALKENVDTVEVNAVRCAPGETVAKDQVLLEVQADKTALDVPSPSAGRVTDVRVKVGEQIKVGQVICSWKGAATAKRPKARPPGQARRSPKAKQPEAPTKTEAPSRPQPKTATVAAPAPAVNRLARPDPPRAVGRELGVDLTQVAGSGRAGRVVEEDVKAFVANSRRAPSPGRPAGGAVQAPPLPNFEQWGPVEVQPLSRSVKRPPGK